MTRKSQYIVGSDLDGTLSFTNEVNDADAIAEFRRAGHIFGCITGRPLCNTLPTFSAHNAEYDFIAPMDGAAAITSDGKIIFDERIDGKILVPLLRFLQSVGAYECSVDIDLFTRRCMAINHERNGAPKYFTTKIDELTDVKCFSHIAFRFDTPDITEEISKVINERFGEYLDAQYHEHNVNCPKRGLDKGVALARVAEFYSIDADRIYAVGNDMNDLAMLTRHNGYTVSGAYHKVKELVPVCGDSAGSLLYMLSKK